MDIRTNTQREREKKHKRICERFMKLTKAYPEAAPYRLATVVAKVEKLRPYSVRRILIANNLWTVRR